MPIRCCLNKAGPRETSLIHKMIIAINGRVKGRLTAMQVRSKPRFHRGFAELDIPSPTKGDGALWVSFDRLHGTKLRFTEPDNRCRSLGDGARLGLADLKPGKEDDFLAGLFAFTAVVIGGGGGVGEMKVEVIITC